MPKFISTYSANRRDLSEKSRALKRRPSSIAPSRHIVLRLPPYHWELNPIELIWADIKNYVTRHNTSATIEATRNILAQAIGQVTDQKWFNCCNHIATAVEPRMWQSDQLCEDLVEQLIIEFSPSADEDDPV
ncbi:hypothetical protein V9T40_003348 [Parthenolecanium corni]|uniref:Tc1-like transposase DDE domain-containing protein n=1 Tax=Parthenolecanium corni TaxID=536013 RepID=A0AAN9Y9L5_9HEMI